MGDVVMGKVWEICNRGYTAPVPAVSWVSYGFLLPAHTISLVD